MKEKYNILYLPLFYEDLNSIINYILYELSNKIAAMNLINEIEEKIEQRAYSIGNYEKYISTKNRKDVYYRIYVKNYTIFYTINGETMEIRRILSSKRNLKKLI